LKQSDFLKGNNKWTAKLYGTLNNIIQDRSQ
jgi:hypothetical protein